MSFGKFSYCIQKLKADLQILEGLVNVAEGIIFNTLHSIHLRMKQETDQFGHVGECISCQAFDLVIVHFSVKKYKCLCKSRAKEYSRLCITQNV